MIDNIVDKAGGVARFIFLTIMIAGLPIFLLIQFLLGDLPEQKKAEEVAVQSCDNPQIKGNISFEGGEKIYHTPGQEFYEATTINEDYGEKMFCSEQEAQDAGWRKASQ